MILPKVYVFLICVSLLSCDCDSKLVKSSPITQKNKDEDIESDSSIFSQFDDLQRFMFLATFFNPNRYGVSEFAVEKKESFYLGDSELAGGYPGLNVSTVCNNIIINV